MQVYFDELSYFIFKIFGLFWDVESSPVDSLNVFEPLISKVLRFLPD